MLYQSSYQPGLSTPKFDLIKSIFRSIIVFSDVIVNQVGSQHELITSNNKSRKVREFVSVVYKSDECICSSTPIKYNALRNLVKYNKAKISN